MNNTSKFNLSASIVITMLLLFATGVLSSCSKQIENNVMQTTSQDNQTVANATSTNTTSTTTLYKKAGYFDIDTLSGSLKATDNTAVAWQKSGLIRSEVKVFMDTVHWASDIPSSSTMSNRTDLNGDGKDEQIAIISDPKTAAMSVNITMEGKIVNLFSLVSSEFLEAAKQMPGGDDGSNLPNYIDAACKDLDGDNKREIILAFGNDNGALVISLLKYVGGDLLYKEVGGIKGTKELRYIIVTTDNNLFAQLYFTNPPTFETLPMNYVEYTYNGRELELIRYRDISKAQESIDGKSNKGDKSGNSNNSQVTGPVQKKSFAEYARIKTWYSAGGFSSETAWVHFKAVDAQGSTIKETLDSDQMNMRQEQSALVENPKRRELVDQLRKDMILDGWTEVGVADGGEWYEYIFGR